MKATLKSKQKPKRDLLVGRIQEAYGVSKDEAEKQLFAWQQTQQDPKAAQ